MTRRLLRATVTIEYEYELFVDVPTYMTEDDITSEIEALVHDGDTLPINVTTTTNLYPADGPDGQTVTVLYGDDETMASGEGYTDRRDRDHAVSVLFPGVEIVEVEG